MSEDATPGRSNIVSIKDGVNLMPDHPMERPEPDDEGGKLAASPTKTPAADDKLGTQYKITGFLISAVCDDGVMRQVTLTDKQSKKFVRFLLRLHGGAIELAAGALYVLGRKAKEEKPLIVPARELGPISRFRGLFKNGSRT